MFVDIEGKVVLVVGGGSAAFRKIRVLKGFKAGIVVIARNICDEIYDLAVGDGSICLKEKDFEASDIMGADIVISAAGDQRLDRIIYETCVQQRIPVNIVDKKELCTFIFPAIYRDDPLVVAVSTGGKAPGEAAKIRDMIKRGLPDNISEQITAAGIERMNKKRR